MEHRNRYDGVHPRAIEFVRYHARQLARHRAVPGMELEDYEQDLITDPEHMLAVYRAHNEEVRRTIVPDRLLVFDVAEGWATLCAFLEVLVPDTPFPQANSTQEFRERVAAAGHA